MFQVASGRAWLPWSRVKEPVGVEQFWALNEARVTDARLHADEHA